MAKPTLYTKELIQEICDRLSTGEPLAKICREEGKPSVTTIWNWGKSIEGVSESIARAREEGEDWIAAECLDIADDTANDYTESENGERFNSEHVQRSKLRIDTRLKLLAKWNPKKYGDKAQLDHTSSDKSMTPTVIEIVAPNNDSQKA